MMRIFYTLLVISILHTPFSVAAQNFDPEKIAKKLLERMATEPDAFHSVNIVLSDRVDLYALDEQLAAQRGLPAQRSETVISALKEKTAATQGELLAFLKNSPASKPAAVNSFWVANAIFAELKSDLIAELSQRPDVAWIGLNGKLEMEAFSMKPAPPMLEPNNRERGLSVIEAPALWAMGYTGYGQLAFTNDTGVDPDVPAIATHYRGFYTNTNAAFFLYDENTQAQEEDVEPFDCGLHGTHVNGTILGLERMANDTIGVAFNAQWIGGSILCGLGTEDNIASFQWSLDPDGNPATTDDMPDVINNSWYDPSLDELDCFSVYVPVLEALEAAGIAVVFSAGNEGPGVGTITPPHNINVNLVNAFTVGALNGNAGSLPIASFSSRGPSHCDSDSLSLQIKPEVSAPGVEVRSCIPGGYGLLSGTSMASPHVAGAILLLKEAFPYLPGKEFKLALYYSCTDLGLPGEDNTFGMGVISVLDAYNYLIAQGHVPVSPFVSKDVLFVDLQLPEKNCEAEVSPIIVVENGGSDTLTSFEVNYEVGNVSNIFTWTGSLAQKERANIHLPTLNVPPGDYRIRISLAKPNGVDDERPLNNVFEKNIQVLDRERLVVQLEGSAVPCEGESALLRASYSGPGRLSVEWFDQPFGGSPIALGNEFASPVLSAQDTFYAQATYNIPIGLADKNTAPSAVLDVDKGLKFNVFRPFLLKSVRVFSEETGLVQVKLLNNDGETIESTIKQVQVGQYELELNFQVPAGLGLSLVKEGGKPLYCNTSGIDYPFTVPGLMSITGPSDNTNDAYYNFYEWNLELPEICERTMTVVPASSTENGTAASFTSSLDSVELNDNQAIQFTNTSGGEVTAFDWNFGDGTGSTSENPAHTFEEAGQYVVSLTTTNANGCTSFALDTITVTLNALSGTTQGLFSKENIVVYPNPATSAIFISLELDAAKMITLQLSDMTGKVVSSSSKLASQNDMFELDISTLTTGVYFLLVKTAESSAVWKVVKI